MSSKKSWLKFGTLNTFDHFFVRLIDVVTTFSLIWILTIHQFSVVVIAQAIVAPFLFVFFSPENVIYRDFESWKKLGLSELGARLHALRVFGYAKLFVAMVLAIGAAPWMGEETSFFESFAILGFAFLQAVTPQTVGTDREYLRVELQIRRLNLLSIYQKLSFLILTVGVVALTGQIVWLFFGAMVSTCTSLVLCRRTAKKQFMGAGGSREEFLGQKGTKKSEVILPIIKDFSIWNHGSSVLLNWFLTIEVLFMGGVAGSRLIGLYGAMLKYVNFSMILPHSFSNFIGVWLARKQPDFKAETKRLTLWSVGFVIVLLVQMWVMVLLAPMVFDLLSRGRWGSSEIEEMVSWVKTLVVPMSLFGSAYLWFALWTARVNVRKVFLSVHLVWLVLVVAVMGNSRGGMDPVIDLLYAKGGSAASYFFISIFFTWGLVLFSKKKRGT